MKFHYILVVYILILNLAGFFSMGIDKQRARKGQWRIPEKTLFLLSLLGGSLGSLLGMYTFRHKTKHWYFRYGFPLILLAQLVLIGYFYFR
ncbi:MAG: DUF1294 domain-containing protein [Lachnospiraceae bacterium]|nr:DUF1294 domain-containing protein [Lachnospiraceae bacterium]